jgi:hypothetical protein
VETNVENALHGSCTGTENMSIFHLSLSFIVTFLLSRIHPSFFIYYRLPLSLHFLLSTLFTFISVFPFVIRSLRQFFPFPYISLLIFPSSPSSFIRSLSFLRPLILPFYFISHTVFLSFHNQFLSYFLSYFLPSSSFVNKTLSTS